MAKVRGEDVVLLLTEDQFPIICARNITFEINRDTIETSITLSGQFRTYVSGAMEWSGTIEGLTYIANNTTSNQTVESLYFRLLLGSEVYIRWYEKDINNDYYLSKAGNVIIDTISETSSFDNIATFNATFKGTGPIDITIGNV